MAPCLNEHNVPLAWLSASSSYFSQSILNTIFCVKMSNFCYKSNLIIHILCLNSVAHSVLLESENTFQRLIVPRWALHSPAPAGCGPPHLHPRHPCFALTHRSPCLSLKDSRFLSGPLSHSPSAWNDSFLTLPCLESRLKYHLL